MPVLPACVAKPLTHALALILKQPQEELRRVPCSQAASFRAEPPSAGDRVGRRLLRWQIPETGSEGAPNTPKQSLPPVRTRTQRCIVRQEVRSVRSPRLNLKGLGFFYLSQFCRSTPRFAFCRLKLNRFYCCWGSVTFLVPLKLNTNLRSSL